MKLTPEQRAAFFDALPKTVGGESILVFEDDGQGWHHTPNDPTAALVDTWVSWSLLSSGIRYLYNIRSCISEFWNADLQLIDDERGQLERGTVAIYVCSTQKIKTQDYSSEISKQIDRTRLGLSLEIEEITTGPAETTTRPLGSYVDNRLKKRVYRTLIEVPILYKSVVIERPPLIKTIELHPWMGWPTLEMEHYFVRAPLLLKADMLLFDTISSELSASIVLAV